MTVSFAGVCIVVTAPLLLLTNTCQVEQQVEAASSRCLTCASWELVWYRIGAYLKFSAEIHPYAFLRVLWGTCCTMWKA